jgi:hypothetical protein
MAEPFGSTTKAASVYHPSTVTPTKSFSTLVFCIMLSGQTILGAETESPAQIMWKLDNITNIGGQKPQVLGAPKLIDASAGGPALHFNGQNDGLIVPVNPIAGWPSFTIEVLFRPDANGPRAQRFLHILDPLGGRVLIETRTDGKSWILDTYLAHTKKGRTLRNRAKSHPLGQWTWVALTYDGKKMIDYVNGVRDLEGRTSFPSMTNGVTSVGMRLNQVFWFKGSIKEARFTSVALKPDALQRVPEN